MHDTTGTTSRALGFALSLATLDSRSEAAEILLETARRLVRHAYMICNGNASQAAAPLGVSRRTMFDWIAAFPAQLTARYSNGVELRPFRTGFEVEPA